MAYHGYIGLIRQYIDSYPNHGDLSIIEIGIDKGITLAPILAHLVYTRPKAFKLMGVDQLVREDTKSVLGAIASADETQYARQSVFLIEKNSLEVLPQLVESGAMFDIFLLDGDHNYYTVSKELEMMKKIIHKDSLVIVDDYNGRWSDKDLWYIDRADYTTERSTPRVDGDKHGVKAAVDEFVANNPEWRIEQPINGEPVLLLNGLKLS